MEKKHYYGIDWLRTFACLGIVMMHMLANNNYALSGFTSEKAIPSFTNFVFLFMTVSAFGMCIGYYDKVKSGKINWAAFYKKRYIKVLPFFAVVVFADIVVNHNLTSLIDAVPNLTLTRGFFPNSIEQIGVAWFLGVIFVFYAVFPLFCSLLNTKRSAWIFFAVSIVLHFVVSEFYAVDRSNIVYCLQFLTAGGLVYLYREKIQRLKWYFVLPVTLAAIAAYYLIGFNAYICLLVSAVFLIQAITVPVKDNKCISFFSGISMEVYLSHMVMFRVIERLHLNTLFGNGWIQYSVTVLLVVVSTVIFSVTVNKIIKIIEDKIMGTV